ncbi:MAG: hypothetical protein IPN29_13000 [Saprospiraceae bacterium]|nr:hypothetical protein [Saprospiraceae bacterium]
MARLNSTLFYGTLILLIYGCFDRSHNPKPTEVLETMEDGNHGEARQKWLTDIHGGPQSNWQQIEYENNLIRLADPQYANSPKRDGEEVFANGAVSGKWVERGSNNQAGSVMNVLYHKEADELYAIGAGGPLFKGGLSGFTWELVNDDYRFDHALLEVVILPDLTTRLVSGISGSPHYSDDGGLTWIKSSGVDGGNMHTGLMADGIIYLLAKKGGGNYILYSSEDGKTYKNRKIFDTSDGRNLALCKASDGKAIYLIEQRDVDKSHLYTIRNRASAMELKTPVSSLGFGGKVAGPTYKVRSKARIPHYMHLTKT